jgi:hypothetical protein
VDLAKGMLFMELKKARVIGCGVVVGLIISRSLALVV